VEGEPEPLKVTPEHPFLAYQARNDLSAEESDPDSQPKGEWIEAGHLKVGDQLRTATGTWAAITDIKAGGSVEWAYNFEVAGNHSYFVGNFGVLTHNSKSKCGYSSAPFIETDAYSWEAVGERISGSLKKDIEARSRFIDLYHATSGEKAHSIITQQRIDLSRSRPNLDFGKGFYTTKDFQQAADWAGTHGVVLHFRLRHIDIQHLKIREPFSGATPAWEQFVRAHRTGAPLHPHDIVEGPMLANVSQFLRGAPAVGFGHQMSFHTEQAIQALMRGLQK
jgi:hypothetical protein